MRSSIFALAVVVLGCSPSIEQRGPATSPPPAAAPGSAAGSPPAAAPDAAAVSTCPAPTFAAGAFAHKRSALVVMTGGPHHGAVDPVVLPGEAAEIYAKFTYGPTSKDLEGERVVMLRSESPVAGAGCPTLSPHLAAVTDRDGVVRFPVPAGSAPGRYPFVLGVEGDHTLAEGAVWVVPAAARVVIFDIDGTLTEGDEALVEQILSGHSPPPRAGAAAVAHRHLELGALPIFLTGRLAVLGALTRGWLSEHGFPPGPVITTTSASAAMPTADGVQRFKHETLTRLLERGVVIERAYGNAVTDICAYARAGIPPEKTFIAGSHGGEACDGGPPTVAVASYEDLLAALH